MEEEEGTNGERLFFAARRGELSNPQHEEHRESNDGWVEIPPLGVMSTKGRQDNDDREQASYQQEKYGPSLPEGTGLARRVGLARKASTPPRPARLNKPE